MVLSPRREQQKLEQLLQFIGDLRRYQAGISQESFLGSRDLQYQVIFPLTLGVQAAVDLGAMAIARRGLPRPETNADTFRTLGEAGLLDAALAGRLVEAAQARNFLVHQYAKLDAARVWLSLAQDVDDLEAFAKALT